MQIKKKFFSLLLSLICVLAINQKIYAQNDTMNKNHTGDDAKCIVIQAI